VIIFFRNLYIRSIDIDRYRFWKKSIHELRASFLTPADSSKPLVSKLSQTVNELWSATLLSVTVERTNDERTDGLLLSITVNSLRCVLLATFRSENNKLVRLAGRELAKLGDASILYKKFSEKSIF
jgi:hypothetical protein